MKGQDLNFNPRSLIQGDVGDVVKICQDFIWFSLLHKISFCSQPRFVLASLTWAPWLAALVPRPNDFTSASRCVKFGQIKQLALSASVQVVASSSTKHAWICLGYGYGGTVTVKCFVWTVKPWIPRNSTIIWMRFGFSFSVRSRNTVVSCKPLPPSNQTSTNFSFTVIAKKRFRRLLSTETAESRSAEHCNISVSSGNR